MVKDIYFFFMSQSLEIVKSTKGADSEVPNKDS